jgi:hypothetical protein
VTAPTSLASKDCPPFRDRHIAAGRRSARDLFFDARPTTARQANLFGGTPLQLVGEFIATTANCLWMQAGNFQDDFYSAMPEPRGFAPRHPSPLLLIEPTEQQIELPMLRTLCLFTVPTSCATAFVNRSVR